MKRKVYYSRIYKTPYIKAEGLDLPLEELEEHTAKGDYIISFSKIIKVAREGDDFRFTVVYRCPGMMGRGRYNWYSKAWTEKNYKVAV